MLNQILVIDVQETNIPVEYLSRIKKLASIVQFISRNDLAIYTAIKDADAVLVSISTKVDKELLDVAQELKYIGVCSTAYDAVDVAYAASRGIAVCNLGGYSTEAVAEFFFAALFEQIRDLEKAKNQARKEDYSFTNFVGTELKDKTLGVIGAGRIGGRIAQIGLGIGMKVVYFCQTPKPELDKLDAQQVGLDQLVSQSDFVSLNLSLNKETEGIINASRVNALKKGCILINLSPPKLLDQEAIITRANNGEIVFAFDHSDDIDPALAKQYLDTKNCIVYPPIAFRTIEANTARWETFTANIENFIGGKLTNKVNSF